MTERDRQGRDVLRRIGYWAFAGVVVIIAVAALLHMLRYEPPLQPGINSDTLGPEQGETVEEYVAAAAETLAGGDDADEQATADADARWALVSFDAAMTPAGASTVVEQLERVSRVVVQTPREGLAMPVWWQDVPEPVGDEGRDVVYSRVLEQLAESAAAEINGDGAVGEEAPARSEALAALSVEDLRQGCPAIIGAVARSSMADLRRVADADGVRAVEALPADAIWGRFAVRPLLPQHSGVVEPLPDSEAVPQG